MRLPLILLLLFFGLSIARAGQEMFIERAAWSVPKTAQVVLAMPVLQAVMHRLQDSAKARLTVYFPGGDEGSLWAIELRGWLVSLGLEASRIKLISGSQYPDRLQLQIEE